MRPLASQKPRPQLLLSIFRLNYGTTWSISARPSILGSVQSLLPVYEAARPTKTTATAVTFYVLTQLCYYVIHFYLSFHSRFRAIPAMAVENGCSRPAVFTSPFLFNEAAHPTKTIAVAMTSIFRLNYATMGSISAHPSIPGSVPSLQWP